MTQGNSPQITNKALHITVGVAPSSNLDLTHELRLLKAALLYADKVKLCSISSTMLLLVAGLGQLDEDGTLELIKQVAESLGKDPAAISASIEAYKALRKKRRRNRQELIALNLQKHNLDRTRSELKQVAENIFTEAKGKGLISALQSEAVEVQWFDITKKDVVRDYFDVIAESIVSDETYPLLDDSTSDLVQAAIRENKIVPLGTSTAKAKQAGLSADLFSRLPLFDEATIDEIIDIRKELQRPLVRFRSAIIGFSRDIQDAPWERAFSQEVDQIFLERIQPAVLEIEDAYRSNPLLLKLISNFAQKPLGLLGSSALGLLISQASQLPMIVSQALSLSAGAVVIGLDAVHDWQEKNRKIEKNQLYFYYKVGKSL